MYHFFLWNNFIFIRIFCNSFIIIKLWYLSGFLFFLTWSSTRLITLIFIFNTTSWFILWKFSIIKNNIIFRCCICIIPGSIWNYRYLLFIVIISFYCHIFFIYKFFFCFLFFLFININFLIFNIFLLIWLQLIHIIFYIIMHLFWILIIFIFIIFIIWIWFVILFIWKTLWM